MVRYEQIAAGASWVDEYGSVKNPDEAAFLEKISPYAQLRKGVKYPEPYIWTTTKDDRVGPQHARKFAARMKEYGLPYLFYEDTAGGHSGDADIEQGARLAALQTTYFAQALIGSGK
jgi:prolyl oligopeptidase